MDKKEQFLDNTNNDGDTEKAVQGEQRKLKPKVDIDDTDSYEGSDDFRSQQRQNSRQTKRTYKYFIKENKKFWISFNVVLFLASIGFQIGTYFILAFNSKDEMSEEQYKQVQVCVQIKYVQYFIFGMHSLNTLIALVNFTGMEIRICSANLVCGLLLFEIGMLTFMQITYFQSMKWGCMERTPSLYFWLMGQILAVYFGIGVIVCYFLKKFCRDPEEEVDEEKPEDKQNEKEPD